MLSRSQAARQPDNQLLIDLAHSTILPGHSLVAHGACRDVAAAGDSFRGLAYDVIHDRGRHRVGHFVREQLGQCFRRKNPGVLLHSLLLASTSHSLSLLLIPLNLLLIPRLSLLSLLQPSICHQLVTRRASSSVLGLTSTLHSLSLLLIPRLSLLSQLQPSLCHQLVPPRASSSVQGLNTISGALTARARDHGQGHAERRYGGGCDEARAQGKTRFKTSRQNGAGNRVLEASMGQREWMGVTGTHFRTQRRG